MFKNFIYELGFLVNFCIDFYILFFGLNLIIDPSFFLTGSDVFVRGLNSSDFNRIDMLLISSTEKAVVKNPYSLIGLG